MLTEGREMKCPLDEKLLVDYLEGELEHEEASRLDNHLKSCPVCREEYETLQEAKKALLCCKEQTAVEEPGESFWQESSRIIAEATYRHREGASAGGIVVLLNRWRPLILAAAAVLLLVLAGTLEWRSRSGTRIQGLQIAAGESASNVITPGDSLFLIGEAVFNYGQATNTLEAIGELAADSSADLPPEAAVFPVGRSVYESLVDLEDQQLENVMLALASR
jgi:predicted anti-sigma-YlaC factor YlaD